MASPALEGLASANGTALADSEVAAVVPTRSVAKGLPADDRSLSAEHVDQLAGEGFENLFDGPMPTLDWFDHLSVDGLAGEVDRLMTALAE